LPWRCSGCATTAGIVWKRLLGCSTSFHDLQECDAHGAAVLLGAFPDAAERLSPQFAAALERRASLVAAHAQIAALRAGLQSVTPASMLALITWRELREGVCGADNIRIEDLRNAIAVSPGVPAQTASWLFKALAGFTSAEKSKFLAFVTGCGRLPRAWVSSAPVTGQAAGDGSVSRENTGGETNAATTTGDPGGGGGGGNSHGLFAAVGNTDGGSAGPLLTVQPARAEHGDAHLPSAHTCSYTLDLPAYTSEETLRERLMFAITNCRDIDNDFGHNGAFGFVPVGGDDAEGTQDEEVDEDDHGDGDRDGEEGVDIVAYRVAPARPQRLPRLTASSASQPASTITPANTSVGPSAGYVDGGAMLVVMQRLEQQRIAMQHPALHPAMRASASADEADEGGEEGGETSSDDGSVATSDEGEDDSGSDEEEDDEDVEEGEGDEGETSSEGSEESGSEWEDYLTEESASEEEEESEYEEDSQDGSTE